MKNLALLLIMLCSLVAGCGIRYDIDVEKFETATIVVEKKPLKIITPENAGITRVVNLNKFASTGLDIQLDLDKCYSVIKELFSEVFTESATNKWLSVKITEVQYEAWGFCHVAGSYMYFTVETSSGLRKSFKTQDQSGWSIDRAVSGNLSRGVEAILKDPDIQKFILSD